MGIVGIGDMLGIGDMGGMEGMFFMASFIEAQQDLSSFVWLVVVVGLLASQQVLCPGCAMRRYRPATMMKIPTAMPVIAKIR
ncbi:hypothetical protein [Mycobacterium xenopi]|uniref:Uncharacterized protein n=2 Tax=Mycobacterium xenopi TaxID=1789 RepID=A0AAD1GY57_MYCXE|nr:hypothetical protein [Mycobacterium xenopi]EUA29901.1 hypothetical protein I553_4155 [Mycobacterium xenopi 4042]EUA50598.1 hypothetical protein I552_1536 [Mycobacterium xenopi 3993]MDA3642145.1 hypothetical protein [Mycobacterium xenopi]MDA3660204.1 hypothetical protein [Mycobacterium xenopi]MDA3664854.1 hypothetical protein [Mycobacterium xenopi]